VTTAPTSTTLRRLAWGTAIALGVALLGWQMATASGGTPDPTASGANLSHAAVVFDAGILVLREGLETILVIAAVVASLRGGNASYRRPVAAGCGVALVATVATWFVVIAITDAVGAGSLDLQAATGLLAVVVLMVVMNWFFHKMYWTGWIAHHHRRRRRLVEQAPDAGLRRTVLGLALLGFTSVYREGFEVVLFLQNLRLRYGSGAVLEGVAIGLVFVAAIGVLTFQAQRKLPYKRMLIATGVLLGVVLVVMVGESVQELQLAGWIGTTPLHVAIPGWVGLWFAIFPNVEGLVAQALAAAFVVGSYFLAEHLKVRRPAKRGEAPATRPVAPPPVPLASGVD